MASVSGRTGSTGTVALCCFLFLACGPSTEGGGSPPGASTLGAAQPVVVPSVVAPSDPVASGEIHREAVPGFRWLPPIGRPVHHRGAFVAGLDPVVIVEQLPLGSREPIAVFTTTSGPHHARVRSVGRSHYEVEWETRRSHLDPAKTYRVRVELDGFELGFVDLDVVRPGHHRHHRTTHDDELVRIVDDRVLPIRFRIEREALRCVGVVCTAQDQCHEAGTCDPATGLCSNPARPDGTPCDDGNFCTAAAGTSGTAVDACLGGECHGALLACDDGDPCTRNGCDPTAPGLDHVTGCVYVPDRTLAGCTTPPPEATVSIVGLKPATTGFHVNQRLSLAVRLAATADRADYEVEFLLAPEPSLADSSVYAGVAVGTRQILLVASGERDYWVELEIPSTLPAGRWVIAAHEYPTGERFYPGPEDPQLVLAVEGPPERPVLDITALEVAQAALLVDPDSTVSTDPTVYRDAPFAANLQVVSQNVPAAGVPVTAHLTWNGQPVPLQLWDAAQRRWVSTLTVQALDADAPTGVYLELALAEADAARIRPQLIEPPADATIVVAVNESGAVDEARCVVDDATAPVNCRHTAQVTALVYPAPPAAPSVKALAAAAAADRPRGNTEPLRYEKAWSRRLGNDLVRVGLAFSGYAQLSKDGYEASARGTVPVNLHNLGEFNFVDARALADALVADQAHVRVTVQVLGITVYEPVDLAGTSIQKDLGELVELPKVQKEKSVEKEIIVYVVPVTFKLGASAELGLEGTITARLTIGATATTDVAEVVLSGGPYAKAEGFGSAGVGVSVFNAGARVTVTLIDAHLTATAGGALTLTRRADDARPLEIAGDLSERLSYATSFLNGRIGMTVTYPTLRWCKALFVWVPCGFRATTKEAVLCSWPGFSYGGDLLNRSQRLFTIDLCTPTTSCAGTCERTIDNGCRPEVCTCPAGETCIAGACAQQPFAYPGLYYVQHRWGAAAGLWRDETIDARAEPLEVTADRRVYRGEVPVNNPVFTGNHVQWTMGGGNETAGNVTFLDGSTNSYIWGAGGQRGILFEGTIQFPGEGDLDYRGVRMCVPTTTCEGRCGPLFDGCSIISCGACLGMVTP